MARTGFEPPPRPRCRGPRTDGLTRRGRAPRRGPPEPGWAVPRRAASRPGRPWPPCSPVNRRRCRRPMHPAAGRPGPPVSPSPCPAPRPPSRAGSAAPGSAAPGTAPKGSPGSGSVPTGPAPRSTAPGGPSPRAGSHGAADSGEPAAPDAVGCQHDGRGTGRRERPRRGLGARARVLRAACAGVSSAVWRTTTRTPSSWPAWPQACARYGVEARHLRLHKHAAEREAGFIEQIVLPLLKQRNPEARQRAAGRR